MIIDGHSHLTFPVEKHIEAMDKAFVAKTILFSTSFHPELAKNAEEVKSSMQYLADLLAGKKGNMTQIREKSNEELKHAIEKYPNRYIGFGAVPPELNLKDTMEYVYNNISRNHFCGMGEFTLRTGMTSLLENIFKVSRELSNLPIWIHGFFPMTLNDIKKIYEFAALYPLTPVILGHLGGVNWLESMDMAKQSPNLFLDTSAYYSTFVLKTVINGIPEKCIFGVDRPFGDIELSIEAVRKVSNSKSISDAVLGENMASLLKL